MPRSGQGGSREDSAGKQNANLAAGGTAAIMPQNVRPYGGQGATAPSELQDPPQAQSLGRGGQGRGGGVPPTTGLAEPTMRPDEPLTMGLHDEAVEPVIPNDPYEFLRALATKYPENDDVRRLLSRYA